MNRSTGALWRRAELDTYYLVIPEGEMAARQWEIEAREEGWLK
jgi:hypothetical protein